METEGDYQLRQVLKSEELSTLAARIKGDFPYCISIHNNLLMAAKGYNRGFQYEFYVPIKYPDSHIVVWKKKTKPFGMSFHCTEEEKSCLMKMIQDSQVLSIFKEDPVYIFHLPDYLIDTVREVIQPNFEKPLVKIPLCTFNYVTQQDYPLRCPAGMRVHRLGKAGVRHLLHTSNYSKHDSVDHIWTLSTNTPAVGVYLDQNIAEETIVDLDNLDFADPEAIPISWVATYHFGPFGMLRTDEGFRGRGLASLLTEVIGRLQIVDGYFPHAHVELENLASMKMFEKLAGWSETYRSWYLIQDGLKEEMTQGGETKNG